MTESTTTKSYAMIASATHFRTFLIIAACVAASGLAAHLGGGALHPPSAGAASAGSAAPRPTIFAIYLVPALMDWLLVFFIWRGVRRSGGALSDVIGGSWRKLLDAPRDLLIAIVFWIATAFAVMALATVMSTAVASGGAGGADFMASLIALSPHHPLEACAWVLTALSAGFCEEIAFRGYAMRQLQALSQNTFVAIVGQAMIFAIMHAYQGALGVIMAGSLGLFYGVLAAWRRSLRPGMIAHAWQDIWGGWLAFALMR